MKPELSQIEIESRDAAAMSLLRGTSLTKPLQKKVFTIAEEVQVWVSYDVAGRPVHLIAGIMSNAHFARLACDALNFEQQRLVDRESGL